MPQEAATTPCSGTDERTLTAAERTGHAQLLEAVRARLGAAWAEPRVALTVLFCSKGSLQGAVSKYAKWVDTLQAFGFASMAEVLGPTASAFPSTTTHWADAADWAALRADGAAHSFLHPAGVDAQGRQVLWERGLMKDVEGREKVTLRVLTLVWLALHADLHTLRHGVTIVHVCGENDANVVRDRATRRLIASACAAMPLRPKKVMIAGLSRTGVALARTVLRLVFTVTRTKLLRRMRFVAISELWDHIPHASIPQMPGWVKDGVALYGYGGTTHPVDWIEQRLRSFEQLLLPSEES